VVPEFVFGGLAADFPILNFGVMAGQRGGLGGTLVVVAGSVCGVACGVEVGAGRGHEEQEGSFVAVGLAGYLVEAFMDILEIVVEGVNGCGNYTYDLFLGGKVGGVRIVGDEEVLVRISSAPFGAELVLGGGMVGLLGLGHGGGDVLATAVISEVNVILVA
jgi:hypothetical protein